MPAALVPLCGYLQTRLGRCSGISFIDSTSLKVCHNRRIHSHKGFAGCANRGKTSVDWFYGFKLHLVVNDRGELLGLRQPCQVEVEQRQARSVHAADDSAQVDGE